VNDFVCVEEHALYFRSQLQSEPVTVGSPLRGAVVATVVTEATGVTTDLRQILWGDYIPADSESPQETNSSITSSVSMCGPTNDLFKYQRVEDASVFGTVGKAHKAHLMSHAHCTLYSDRYGKYDDDENNRLALSVELHGFYDAFGSSVPVINIRAVSSTPFQQGAENRSKVSIPSHPFQSEYFSLTFSM